MLKPLLIAAAAAWTLLSVNVANAQEVPPLGDVKVVLVKDLHEFSIFTLAAVPVRTCSYDAPIDGFFVSRCEIDGTRTITLRGANGDESSIDLTSFVYWRKPAPSDDGQADSYHEYHYIGNWTRVVDGVTLSSKAELLVWYRNSDMADLRGWLNIEKYGLSYSLQGARL